MTDNVSLSPLQAADIVVRADGSRLYAAGEDGKVRVYDLSTRTLLQTLDVGTRLGGIDISPDGTFLLVSERQSNGAWSGDVFLSSSIVYRVDLGSSAVTSFSIQHTGHDYTFYDVAILANGEALLTQDAYSAYLPLRLLNLATGQFTSTSQTYSVRGVLETSLDRSHALFAEGTISDAPVFIYQAGAGITHSHENYADGVQGYNQGVFAISEAANLVVQNAGGNLNVYDTALGYKLDLSALYPGYYLGANLAGVTFDATGANLYILHDHEDKITQVRTSDWQILRTFEVGTDVGDPQVGRFGNRLELSPDGKTFIISTVSGIRLLANDSALGEPGPGPSTGGPGNDTLIGAEGGDTLTGDAGADTISGFAGSDFLYSHLPLPADDSVGYPYQARSGDIYADTDTLSGGDDSDWFFAGYGDTIDGGANASDGDKLLISFQGAASGVTADFRLLANGGSVSIGGATISGIEQVVSIEGSEHGDFLAAYGELANGNAHVSSIWGRGGNDHLIASYWSGWGDSALYGGEGNDVIDLGPAAYSPDAYGEAGDDRLIGGSGSEQLYGGIGTDTIEGGAGFDQLFGGDQDDALDGGSGNDTLRGESGQDILRGAGDRDFLYGGTGDDQLYGDASPLGSSNELSPESNDDRLFGEDGNDKLYGDQGNDMLDGGAHDDVIEAGTGSDTLVGGEGSDRLFSHFATPGFASPYTALSRDDVSEADSLSGGAGDDFLFAGTGDSVDGGEGWDALYISFLGSAVGVTADFRPLASGAASVAIAGGTFTEIEAVFLEGSQHGDVLAAVRGPGAFTAGVPFGDVPVYGRGGNDTIYATFRGSIFGGEGNDTIDLSAAPTTDVTFGEAGNDTIIGSASNDQIFGGEDDDMMDGGGGADAMDGGAGDDSYVVDQAGDTLTELANGGVDRVESSVTWSLAANFENLKLTGGSAINGTGNSANNVLTGNGAANTLSGGGGNDTMDGGGGADAMDGGAGDDSYAVDNAGDTTTEAAGGGTDTVRSSITWTLGAEIENLVLTGTAAINGTGNALSNSLKGNDGDNVLDGGAGRDSMAGGLGNDTYIVDDAADMKTEAAGAGFDTVHSSVSSVLGANFEALVLTGTAVNGWGNTLDNQLTGNAVANKLDGNLGADWMAGGLGDDVYIVENAGDVIAEAANAGTDTIQTYISRTLEANVENLVLLAAAPNGTGNALANILTGNPVNNILDGGGGADVMDGGGGHDTYHVDHIGDQVIDTGGGNDHVHSSVSYTLATGLEYLTLTGSGAINGTGNSGNNLVTGNGAANVLDGAAGADTMTGGAGGDTYVVENASDKTLESAGGGTDTVRSAISWTLGAEIENLVLAGAAPLNGTGNALANAMTGNSASNRLDGGAGADTLAGGGGNDVYIVDAADTVVEAAVVGTDRVESAVSWTLGANVEDLTLTGSAAVNGTGNGAHNVLKGNSGANTLTGLGGNDVIDGAAGADAMDGGAGHDTFHVDQAGDTVTDTGGGNDWVHSAVSWTLGTGLEYLTLTGSAVIDGTGNAANNLMYGNAAANRLDGGLGADHMVGGAGNDTYVVDSGSDRTVEQVNGGTDTVEARIYHQLQSAVENLILAGTAAINGLGNELGNEMTGNSANNTLTGALGADRLTGGGGNDLFAYRSTAESTAAVRDEILDFTAGDKIDLRAIDASRLSSANNEAFTFIGSNAFGGTAGELRAWEDPSGKWFVEADTNGDKVADMVIGIVTVNAAYVIGAGDFLL